MSAPVTFNSFLASVITELQALLAPVGVQAAQVQSHYGLFDLQALQRFGAGAPAVRIAVIGCDSVDAFVGQLNAKLRFAIYIVTRDAADKQTGAPIPRHISMLGILQALIQAADNNAWGGDSGDQPTGIRAENLYSDDQAGQGVLLWAVSYTQGVNCDVTDIASLAAFEEFTHDINDPVSGETGISQDTTLPQ